MSNELPPPIEIERKPPTLRLMLRHWIRKYLPPLGKERRAEVQIQLREASRPSFDFYVLVALSSVIATMGLLTNSVAVIIGAMLVAPLMSPILGIGLASVTGDDRTARDAAQAILRGMAFAVGMALIITLGSQILPFNPITDPSALPSEIVARTHPSPFDLAIALAGGLAAAYALAQPQISAALPGVAIATALMPPLCVIGITLALGDFGAAAGALLLYLTNLAAIAFAGILTFFSLGFRPKDGAIRGGRVPRSLRVSAVLVVVLLIPLAFFSARFLQQGAENAIIQANVQQAIADRGARLVSVDSTRNGDALKLDITVRSSEPFSYEDVVDLRDDLGLMLHTGGVDFESLALSLSVVPNSVLDPEIPPTLTPTSTLGPTPTVTITVTLTPTWVPTATATPTPTLTPTSTPSILRVYRTDGLGVNLRSEPFGPIIARLAEGSQLTQLYATQIVDGLVWAEVVDEKGRTGWVPLYYTRLVTLTPTPSPTAAATATPAP